MSGLELWWIGQSGFRLRDPDAGPVAFVDPFLSEHKGRLWQAPITPAALAQADLVLCTHQHIDHFDQPALRAAAATPDSRFTLVVPQPLRDDGINLGLPPARVVGVQPGTTYELAGARITPVPACHGVNVDDAYTCGKEMSGGLVRYVGYVVEIGGVRVYHAGDSIPYSDLKDQVGPLHPHLALLPINGRDFFRERQNLVGNMTEREAAQVAVDIGAEALVPMHWGLFDFNRGYPSELITYVMDKLPQLTVLIMGRSGKLVFVPSGKEEK